MGNATNEKSEGRLEKGNGGRKGKSHKWGFSNSAGDFLTNVVIDI